MATRQYIGARYIPVFADPVQWDNTRTYEYLTMVQNSGETYMSKQDVPIGAPLPDVSQGEESTQYWVHMSNWNAQVEVYRQEVLRYNDRISTVENDLPINEFDSTNTVKKAIDDLADVVPASEFDSTNTVKKAIDDLADVIPASEFDSTNTVKAYINNEIEAVENLLPASSFDSTNTVKKAIDDLSALLPADEFDSTNTVDARFDSVETRVASVENKTKKTNMVVIGDSWSYHDDGSAVPNMWDLQVAKALGLTSRNYARGAVGYMRDRTNCFYDQLVQAANEVNPDTVARVYIWGGLNDVYRSEINYSTFQSSVSSTLQKAIELFPNAYIIVAGIQQYQCGDVANNTSSSYLGFAKISLFTAVLSDIFMSTVKHGKFINLQNLGAFCSNFYQSNGHPTQAGHTDIASKILGGNMHNNGAALNAFSFKDSNNNYIGRPVLTVGNSNYMSDGGVINNLGNGLVCISFTIAVPSWGSQTTATLEMRGAPVAPVWIRILGVQTGTVITANPIWRNDTIKQAAANQQNFSKTYSLPITRANFTSNTLIEVSYYCKE